MRSSKTVVGTKARKLWKNTNWTSICVANWIAKRIPAFECVEKSVVTSIFFIKTVLFENLNGGLFAAKNIGVAHNCPKSDKYGDNFGYPAQERNKTQKFQNNEQAKRDEH